MKKIIMASACVLALSAGSAFAQTQQPAPGASSEGNVGPGASQGMKKQGSTKKDMTTGAARADKKMGTGSAPSSSGNVGPGTNSK